LITLVPIVDVPESDVEHLLDAAFGADRHGRTAYRLREGMTVIAGLSFGALENGVLIGSIQCWPIELRVDSDHAAPLILVGPVAVRPDRQRDGIGRMLTAKTLARADAESSDPMMLIGDPEYYDRFFGFRSAPTAAWEVPGPVERSRLLARLRPDQTLPAAGRLEPRRSPAALEREGQ
jgi:predicted N-acetyltransferase YhbS